ncbi:MAG: hypothetical protein ABIV51_14600 [Saprospiraceae bacterium]
MKQADFDKIIKDKLTGIQPKAEASSWDLLSDKLDQISESQQSYAVMEGRMKQKLHAVQPAYQASHWKILSDRLQSAEAFRRRLVLIKSMELALIVLLLISANNYFDYSQPNQSAPSIAENDNPIANQSEIGQLSSRTAAIDISSAQVLLEDKSSKSTKRSLLGNMSGNESNSARIKSSATEHRGSNSNSLRASSNIKSRNSTSNLRDRISGNAAELSTNDNIAKSSTGIDASLTESNSQVLVDENAESQTSTEGNIESRSASNVLSQNGDGLELQSVATLPIVDVKPLELPLRATDEPQMFDEKHKKHPWTPTIGLICGFSNNEIQSPSGGLYSHTFDTQTWISPELGLAYMLDNQIWGLETGVFYSYIQYQGILPRYNSVHFLKVPINLRIIPLSKDGWNLYFTAGAAINIAAFAKYDKAIIQELGTGPFTAKSKEYDTGLFQDGDYKTNTYYTYNVGLGFERCYNNNIRIFAHLSRSSSLFDDRFSPSLNKIKATSFNIGMRLPLK